MQRVDLESRKKCHEEAMGALRGAQDAMLQARGLLETIHGLPEPEGWAFQATIRCLKEWRIACGPAPFCLTIDDIDQLETWGKDLIKSHQDTRQVLSCPPREVKLKLNPLVDNDSIYTHSSRSAAVALAGQPYDWLAERIGKDVPQRAVPRPFRGAKCHVLQ